MTQMRIGYERLSAPERALYECFVQAFSRCATLVDASGIDRGVNVMKVMLAALGDNPDVIYVDKTCLTKLSSLLFGRKLRLSTCFPAAKAPAMRAELEQRVIAIVRGIQARGARTDYQKLLLLHEYLQQHVEYDYAEMRGGRSRSPLSHTAYGALVNGRAVCDGISAAFALIACVLGISCTVVSGKATAGRDGYSEHAWNVLYSGGYYYHLDVTWDLNKRKEFGDCCYEYFCIDDAEARKDHVWDSASVPPCRSRALSFYHNSGCYASTSAQVEELFERASRSGQSILRIKLSDGVPLSRSGGQQLCQWFLDVLVRRGGSVRVEYSWNERLRCFSARIRRQ